MKRTRTHVKEENKKENECKCNFNIAITPTQKQLKYEIRGHKEILKNWNNGPRQKWTSYRSSGIIFFFLFLSFMSVSIAINHSIEYATFKLKLKLFATKSMSFVGVKVKLNFAINIEIISFDWVAYVQFQVLSIHARGSNRWRLEWEGEAFLYFWLGIIAHTRAF